MKTKNQLLSKLGEEKGNWISGESIALSLGITRAAVWKAVKQLREEGYLIDAVRNRGYRLVEETDVLSELGIWKYLCKECRMLDIHMLPEVGSTNTFLWEKANNGCPEGTVLIAGMQTDGHGRQGRRFYSPADTGIYLSLLLRPGKHNAEQVLRLTTIAAVAACETFEAVSGKPALIKWVNDIYMGGRKVCGILTEGVIGLETGLLDAVVLGIGINVYEPEGGFPPEIQSTAGAVFEKKQSEGKNILAAGFLNRFLREYLSGDFDAHVDKYRERNMLKGKKITVFSHGRSRNAVAGDIDRNCRLSVQYEDGTEESLASGEVSIIKAEEE